MSATISRTDNLFVLEKNKLRPKENNLGQACRDLEVGFSCCKTPSLHCEHALVIRRKREKIFLAASLLFTDKDTPSLLLRGGKEWLDTKPASHPIRPDNNGYNRYSGNRDSSAQVNTISLLN